MPNVKFQIPNQCQNPNASNFYSNIASPFEIYQFEIDLTFGI
jgi:hypothetical protein